MMFTRSKTSFKKSLVKLSCVFSLLFPLFSHAATITPDSNPTLDLLFKKGLITEAERNQVIAETKAATPSPNTPWKPLFNTDPIIRHITFMGRIQTQYVDSAVYISDLKPI